MLLPQSTCRMHLCDAVLQTRSDGGNVTAATIAYKTRWVRTSTRPIAATTFASLGPFTATPSLYGVPFVSGSGLEVQSTGLYQMKWNADFEMNVQVTIPNAAVNLMYHHVDTVTDLLTDWSSPARNPWPWLKDPKLLEGQQFFVPYKYRYNFTLQVIM